jgi:hypothetical protein
MSDEDALKDAGEVKSGDEEGTPVHSPTIPEDEGNVGDGTGSGDAGPASPLAARGPAVGARRVARAGPGARASCVSDRLAPPARVPILCPWNAFS